VLVQSNHLSVEPTHNEQCRRGHAWQCCVYQVRSAATRHDSTHGLSEISRRHQCRSTACAGDEEANACRIGHFASQPVGSMCQPLREETKETAETYRSERYFGRFHRTVTLPHAVDANQVKATYKDGVLNISLPKTEEAKRKHIEVKVS
jgi:hypothetical protein